MKSWLARSRQSVANSLFRLGWQSGAAEGLAAFGAARLARTMPARTRSIMLRSSKHAHHLERGLADGGPMRGIGEGPSWHKLSCFRLRSKAKNMAIRIFDRELIGPREILGWAFDACVSRREFGEKNISVDRSWTSI
jgi:hypothetical protein